MSVLGLVNIVDQLAVAEDELAALRKREAEVRKRKRQLLTKLGPFVTSSSYETLRGTRGSIRVRRTQKVNLPLLNSEKSRAQRFRLELRSSGYWEVVSDISFPRIKKLWKNPGRCPPPLQDCLGEFISEESVVEVRRTVLAMA